MGKLIVCLLVMSVVVAAPLAAEELVLQPTKDVRVLGHPSEVDQNGGTSTRIRVSAVQKASGEMIIMDFDRAALKTFLEKQKDAKVGAKLVLETREVQNGPAKVEVCSLDTASDWNEGKGAQVKAEKGEACFSAAQFDTKPWTTADGKEVKGLKDIFYQKTGDKVLTVLNTGTVDVDKDSKTVEIVIDENLLKHLATDANCRGIVLFTRHETAKVDFFSREQSKKGPKLVVATK